MPASAPHAAASDRAERDREDRRLLTLYQRHGSSHAREALGERWMPLLSRLATRYAPRNSELAEELTGAAGLALAKAISRFDLGRPGTFASYAIPTITGELRRHLRDHSWGLRIPRPISERSVRLNKLLPTLTQKLGRPPTAAELATVLGCTSEEILEVFDAERTRSPLSLQAGAPQDHDGSAHEERIGTLDRGYDNVHNFMMLDDAMSATLNDRDAQILRLRFDDDLTQSQIADRFGLSQMQISRILTQSLAKLRRRAELAPDAGRSRPHVAAGP